MMIKNVVPSLRRSVCKRKQAADSSRKKQRSEKDGQNVVKATFFLCFVALCLLLTSCAPGQKTASLPASSEGQKPLAPKEIVHVWTTLPEAWIQNVLQAYAKNDSEVREYQVLSVSEESLRMLPQLPPEERPQLLFAASEELSALATEKALTPLVTEMSDMLQPGLHDENYLWTGLWVDPYMLAVNREYSRRVGQLALASWPDILAKTKPNLAICDPMAVPETAAFFYAWSSRDESDGKVFDELSALHALTKQYSRFAATPVKLVGFGDSDVAVTLSSTLKDYDERQYPLYAFRPEPGGPVRLLGVGLVQVPDAERYAPLIDWLLSSEHYSQVLQKEEGLLSVQQTIENPDLVEQWWLNTKYVDRQKQQLLLRTWLERVRFGK